jgi:hypothetical protein
MLSVQLTAPTSMKISFLPVVCSLVQINDGWKTAYLISAFLTKKHIPEVESKIIA